MNAKIITGCVESAECGFNDPNSEVILDRSHCEEAENRTSSNYWIDGCANLTYKVGSPNGYVGIYYTLTSNAQPVDISQYQAITFYAKSNGGRFSIMIKTDSIKDQNYFQTIRTTTEKGEQITINFEDLERSGDYLEKIKQLIKPESSFSAKDVIAVIWQPVDIEYGKRSYLYIGNAGFIIQT
jgi:hypothetical protein